jgi:hypothetical protein
MLTIMLSVISAQCHLWLCVTNKPFMLSAIMLKVIMLSVMAPIGRQLLLEAAATASCSHCNLLLLQAVATASCCTRFQQLSAVAV